MRAQLQPGEWRGRGTIVCTDCRAELEADLGRQVVKWHAPGVPRVR